MNRKYLIDVLHDTLSLAHDVEWLSSVADYTDYFHLPMEGNATIEFTEEKTQDAAIRHSGWKNVVIHNFASGHSPGGGVRNGSPAQEEDICRCSNLLPSLDAWPEFYEDNKAYLDGNECLDKMIYSTVKLVKDGSYKKLNCPVGAGVITYMAPAIRRGITHERAAVLIRNRLRHVIHRANAVNAEVLITGAWGCGAYGNDPNTVAQIYYDVLTEGTGKIKKIVFAVYGDPTNQKVFRNLAEKLQTKGA